MIEKYGNYNNFLVKPLPLHRNSLALDVEYCSLINVVNLLFLSSFFARFFRPSFRQAPQIKEFIFKNLFSVFSIPFSLVKACYDQKYLATLLSRESRAFSTVKPVLNLKFNKQSCNQWYLSLSLDRKDFITGRWSCLPAKLTSSDYKFPAPIVCTTV